MAQAKTHPPAFDWDDPDDAMLAAVALVRRQRIRTGGAGETPAQLRAAEILIHGKGMLWYQQLTTWLATPPTFVKDAALFHHELRIIADLIDCGYDPVNKDWWGIGKLTPAKRATVEIAVMDLGDLLERASDQTEHRIAASWFTVVALICGANWRRRYRQFLHNAKQLAEQRP
jgi:hypothetical protein